MTKKSNNSYSSLIKELDLAYADYIKKIDVLRKKRDEILDKYNNQVKDKKISDILEKIKDL